MRNPRLNYILKRVKRSAGLAFVRLRKNIRNIVLFFVILGLFSIVAVNIGSIYQKGEERKSVLTAKQNTLDALRVQNEELKADKEFYSSKRYIEEQARNVLGWSYPNEQALVINGTSTASQSVKKDNPIIQQKEPQKYNIDKWFSLLFD